MLEPRRVVQFHHHEIDELLKPRHADLFDAVSTWRYMSSAFAGHAATRLAADLLHQRGRDASELAVGKLAEHRRQGTGETGGGPHQFTASDQPGIVGALQKFLPPNQPAIG